jgi:hypothetical protein
MIDLRYRYALNDLPFEVDQKAGSTPEGPVGQEDHHERLTEPGPREVGV